MTHLENALCAELYHQQLDSLVQREIDSINSDRNRLFIADTIREVGLTNSIQKRFNAHGELDHLFQMAGIESLGSSVSNEDLANAIIGTEGLVWDTVKDRITKMLKGVVLFWSKQFTAGYRWFQSLTDTSEEDIAKIKELLSQIDAHKSSFTQATIEAVDISKVMSDYTSAKTIDSRAKACKYLADLPKVTPKLSFSKDETGSVLHANNKGEQALDAMAKDITKTASELSNAKAVISDSKKEQIRAQDVYRQAKSTAPIVIKALQDIIKTNDTYRGYWKTGFTAGKADAIFTSVLSSMWLAPAAAAGWQPLGWATNGLWHLNAGGIFHDLRAVASYSWSTISRATSIDYELCRMLMSNLKALNRLADR